MTKCSERTDKRCWVISEGRTVNIDLESICEGPVDGPATEYLISDLAYYFLSPNPVHLYEKVVGCKVYHKKKSPGFFRRLFKRTEKEVDAHVEEIISASKTGTPDFRDRNLNAHFVKIRHTLSPFDPVHKRLSEMDADRIADIRAVCEEVGGQRYTLKLQGDINEKINFVLGSLSQKTKVVFARSYLSHGLFEMRAFDFKNFDSRRVHRLVKFSRDNETGYCVLDENYKFEMWVNEHALIRYMHILQQSINADLNLRQAIDLCISQGAQPLKMFFSKKLEHGYTEKRLPVIYRKVFSKYNIDDSEKEAVIDMLNNSQGVIFFNYLLRSDEGRQRIYTNISVMHDSRALEPLKNRLPRVVSEIEEKTSLSEAGKLYLLESLREYQNV